MTYTYHGLRALLTAHGIPDADFDALTLLETFAGASRTAIFADPARAYESEALTDAVEKRLRRVPLQYIIGKWEFMGLPFVVNEHCLIPRADTEHIAEAAIARKPRRVLDLCTGSGCILASVLHYCPDASGVAVDCMADALAVAAENFRLLGVAERVQIVCGDVRERLIAPEERFDVITANPPYITADEMKTLAPELSAEPRIALTDGGDGLSLYQAILENFRGNLADGGVFIVEHGYAQSEAVCAMAAEYGMAARVLRDYGGNVRGAELSRCMTKNKDDGL